MMHATTVSNVENEIIRAVSGERLMRDTEAIARWVRLSGSEDERQAFEYVARVLRVLALEPMLYLARGYISLPQRATLRVEGEELPAITHSMATSTPLAGLHVPLVYVGHGTPQDYARRDVRQYPQNRWPLQRGMLGYTAHLNAPAYSYDPAKAAQILTAAGWTKVNGVWTKGGRKRSLVMTAISGVEDLPLLADAIQGYLNKAGMETTLQSAHHCGRVNVAARAAVDIRIVIGPLLTPKPGGQGHDAIGACVSIGTPRSH